MRDFPTKPYSSPSSSPLCQHDLILPLLLLLLSFLISSPSSPSPRHFPARHPYSSSSSPPKITDGRPAGGAWLRLGPAALQHGRSTFGRERRLERVRRAATSHGLLPTPPSSFSSIIISPIPHHLTLTAKCRAPGCGKRAAAGSIYVEAIAVSASRARSSHAAIKRHTNDTSYPFKV